MSPAPGWDQARAAAEHERRATVQRLRTARERRLTLAQDRPVSLEQRLAEAILAALPPEPEWATAARRDVLEAATR